MTAIVLSARRHPAVPPVVSRSTVRAVALVVAACIIFGAGIAAAARLGGSAMQPTQSQQPSITSTTSR